MITHATEKLKEEIIEFFQGTNHSIDAAERDLDAAVCKCVSEIIAAYYEKLDDELLADKVGRKESGLVVERRKDKRQILTRYGMISFSRTYYAHKSGGYSYPIDAVAGLEGYERVSDGVASALCEKARKYSYGEASSMAAGGLVSKQTVMNKIRMLEKQAEIHKIKKCVPVLHIDADEDHISLQDGSNTIAPLVSVYEGINTQNKRHFCENIIHFPYFETKPDDIWESVLNSLEEIYDLQNTRIYVHGDGGSWIRAAEGWLPNMTFVLDRYHYNKYLKII